MAMQPLRAAGAGRIAAAVVAGALGLAGVAAAGAPAAAVAATAEREHRDRLGRMINERLRAEGPFFTAEERAVIEQACGYAPGSFDGYQANMSDGVFTCTNGRRVESPQMRAVMAAAEPRIGARVRRVMASPEVRGAIEEVTARARADALRGIDRERIAERARARAVAATRRALERLEDAEERRGRR